MKLLPGILLILLASAVMASHDALSKYLTASLPILLIVWFRYFSQFSLLSLFALPVQGKALYQTRHLALQIYRGLALLGLSIFAMIGFKYLPLPETVSIIFTTPILVAVLSAVLFRERFSWQYWALLLLGFCGVLLIIRPSKEIISWMVVFPFLGAVSFAVYQLLTRRLNGVDSVITSNYLTSLVGTIVLLPALYLFWQPLSWLMLILLMCVGALGTVGHLAMTQAFKFAPAAVLSPFSYSQVMFACLLSLWLFHYQPAFLDYAGISLIILSGLLLALYNYYKMHELNAEQS